MLGELFGRIDRPGHNYDPATLGLVGQLPCRPVGLVKIFELPSVGSKIRSRSRGTGKCGSPRSRRCRRIGPNPDGAQTSWGRR